MTSPGAVSSAAGPTLEDDTLRPTGPSLPKRLLYTVFSPGKMLEGVAENPRWIGAVVVAAGLVGLATALIPPEIIAEAQRRAALERGIEVPQASQDLVRILRIVVPVTSVAASVVMTFLLAGVYSIIFAFVLGDEGRYRQYLAVLAHALFVPALAGLLYTPLRISTGDPQFTLNVAAFLTFLPRGYLLNVFRVMDLTQIWSVLIVAQGAHAIDRRRSFGSAAVILLGLLFGLALIIGRFIPT